MRTPSSAGGKCTIRATATSGAISQHLAEATRRHSALDHPHSPNHLKSMKLQILARDVLKALHPERVLRPLRYKEPVMHSFPRNPFTREDTLFGVCEAIGEDFRFNPLLLRIAFGAGLFLNPMLAIGGYAAAGAIVLISRLVAPNPRQPKAAPAAMETAEAARQPLHADNETAAEQLPVAA
jgi:phage shock protein C